MQLANTTQLDIDEARIRQRWLFAERPAAGEAVSSLLESGNGQPLVVEKYVGQGRVLVQAFPLGLEWSNLPLLKAYVVMIHDWLAYVTAPTMARYNLTPGTSIVAAAPQDAAGATSAAADHAARTRNFARRRPTPTSRRCIATRKRGCRARTACGSQAAAAGCGEVPFHVARDASESDLRPLSEADRDKLLVPAGVQFGGCGSCRSRRSHRDGAAPRAVLGLAAGGAGRAVGRRAVAVQLACPAAQRIGGEHR